MRSSELLGILEGNRKFIHKKIIIYGLLSASVLSVIFYFSPIIAFFILSYLVIYNNFKILENKINAIDYHNECFKEIEKNKSQE